MIFSDNRYPLFGIMLWCFVGAVRGEFVATSPGTSELHRGSVVRARVAALASGDLVTRFAMAPWVVQRNPCGIVDNYRIDMGVDLGYGLIHRVFSQWEE